MQLEGNWLIIIFSLHITLNTSPKKEEALKGVNLKFYIYAMHNIILYLRARFGALRRLREQVRVIGLSQDHIIGAIEVVKLILRNFRPGVKNHRKIVVL